MSSLFRPESLQAKNGSWLGSVRLTQPLSYWFVASVGLIVATVIGLFAVFGTYTKKATVPGVLQPPNGAVRLTNAGAGGVLSELRVREGSAVSAGEVLFTISSERTSELGGTQALIGLELKRRADLAQRDVSLSQQRATERIFSGQQRISAIESEIASFERDVQLFRTREALAVDSLSRFEKLAATGFMSTAQVDPKREELLSLQAQQQQLLRSKAALERERTSVLQQIVEAKLQTQMEATELAKARAALGQEIAENSARTKLVVMAPQAGVVSGVSVQLGQTIAPGALLATLLPPDAAMNKETAPTHVVIPAEPAPCCDTGAGTQNGNAPLNQGIVATNAVIPAKAGTHSSHAATQVESARTVRGESFDKLRASTVEPRSSTALEAHFYATTRQAGFVQPGQRVRLRYAAYPYQKFGMGEGEVAEVSRSPYAVQELPTHIAAMLGALAQSGDAVYRVTVRIKDSSVKAYGESHSLKPGMIAEADIVQDTRKLWEWALEPVFSVSGKRI
jgi:membrane fusion protein